MNRRIRLRTGLAALGLAALLLVAGRPQAQEAEASGAAAAAMLSAAELDQLTAPIALYSDPLLGSVLVAATYPLEIVEASRWRDDPANAALADGELAAALQRQSWDTSVKSLLAFPDVLRMLNDDLDWTERLGEAFLAQQADVMDSVQRLRQRAAASGARRSTPQETGTGEDDSIAIEPTTPDVGYTPYYDPAVVSGPWPWPSYPPFAFAPPAGVDLGGAMIVFGIGFAVPSWGGYGWDWQRHGLRVVPRHGSGGFPVRQWSHDAAHRRGVPYHDASVGARYASGADTGRQAFRGYPSATSERAAWPPPRPSLPTSPHPAPPERGLARGPVPRAEPRPSAPAFESFGHGTQVHGESGRGAASRSTPAPRAEPARDARGGAPPHS